MALYPDTSCFYRAEVIASPKDAGRVSTELIWYRGRSLIVTFRTRPGRQSRIQYQRTGSNSRTMTTKNTWCRLFGWSSGQGRTDRISLYWLFDCYISIGLI